MNTHYLSARQAAELLGVSLPTLYSYVSRGLLQSQARPGQRSKSYVREDVLRLQARSSDSRRAGSTAESAIAWGVPVLESRISLVADGQLYYRGHSLGELSKTASLEETALILWDAQTSDAFQKTLLPEPGSNWQAMLNSYGHLAPIARTMSILPSMAATIETIPGLSQTARATLWMRYVAAALLAGTPAQQSLHQQLATCWQVDQEATEVLRAALVVCADHELNVSTFTVRCVASTGAHLGMVLSGGLAALSGPRHGGESLRLGHLVRKGLREYRQQLRPYLDRCMLTHQGQDNFSPRLPGFGHPLYPHGDPRAAILMQMLNRDRHADLFEFADLAQAMTGEIFNIDYALVALEIAHGLPEGSAQILFALGRTAGWIAHAQEQASDGQLIRPRARYVGKFPD